MFRRREPTVPVPNLPPGGSDVRVSSVLGPGIVWRGNLGGSGGVRIEGAFEGDIHLRGLLVIGENGRVTCEDVRAQTVIVAGALRGSITAEKVEIRATGRIWGNIRTVTFTTEEGAFLRGQITMEERIEIAPPPEEALEAPAAEIAAPTPDAPTRATPVAPDAATPTATPVAPDTATRATPVAPDAATRATPVAPDAATVATPVAPLGNTLPGQPRTPTALEPPLIDPNAATRAQPPAPPPAADAGEGDTADRAEDDPAAVSNA
jgi:cytoskeletal protein CcmA (bactofilin family)